MKESTGEKMNTTGKKVVTGALVASLAGVPVGCQEGVEQKETPTDVPDDHIEEVTEQEGIGEEIDAVEMPFEKALPALVSKKFFSHPNYEVNIPEEVLKSYESFKEVPCYSFENKDFSKHIQQNFVNAVQGKNLEHRFRPSPENVHYWEGEDSTISYDVLRGSVFAKFEKPVEISGVHFNVKDMESLQSSLENVKGLFLNEKFDYKVSNVSEQGGLYKIEFDRYLNEIPVVADHAPNYFLVNDVGEIQEASFSVSKMSEIGKAEILPHDSLEEFLNKENARKNVRFSFANIEDYDKFSDPFILNVTGRESGVINTKEMELVYYESRPNDTLLPAASIGGSGFVEMNDEKFESNFEVLANVIPVD